MLALLIALIITLWAGYLIYKKYPAQPVLILGGFILMAASLILGTGAIINAKQSTGFAWFDIFEFMKRTMSSRAAGLGLMIMAVAGFAKYMDYIGASRVLVFLAAKPLSKLKAPYIVMALTYVLGQILALFITSASGLGLLLMVTIYPVLVGLGVSPLSAVAVIATTQSMDVGPGSGNANLSATNAGMDIATYFVNYQIPVGLCIMATVATLHYLVQKYYDKKDGHNFEQGETKLDASLIENLPPKFYAILPCIPIFLILSFSSLGYKGIKMDVVTSMFVTTFIAMICEYFRKHDAKEVMGSLKVFWDGMGNQFAAVITLIVAGEVFANGLKSIGAINNLISGAQGLGFGIFFMVIVMVAIISVSAVVMGSGNAPFFAFAALAPDVASKVGIPAVAMLLPMQFASSLARSVSPITAVIVAVSGAAGINPFDTVKRTAIPMAGGLIVNVIASFIFCM